MHFLLPRKVCLFFSIPTYLLCFTGTFLLFPAWKLFHGTRDGFVSPVVSLVFLKEEAITAPSVRQSEHSGRSVEPEGHSSCGALIRHSVWWFS